MPGYRVHILGGLGTFFAIAFLASRCFGVVCPSVFLVMQYAGACILGSLFPDVDTKSKGQGIFYKIIFVSLLILLFLKKAYLFILVTFIALMPLLVRHRGIFHHAWFLIVVPLVLAFVAGQSLPSYQSYFFNISLFFIAGALSHIALDKVPYLS